MARVTVEDCLDHVENRFQLVILASRRTRQLTMSAMEPMVEKENDKSTVIALREIAAGLVSTEVMDALEKGDDADVDEEVQADS